MINFKLKESFGSCFYIKTDPQQLPGTLVSVILNPGSVIYVLRLGTEVIEVYDFEVDTEPNQEILLNIRLNERDNEL